MIEHMLMDSNFNEQHLNTEGNLISINNLLFTLYITIVTSHFKVKTYTKHCNESIFVLNQRLILIFTEVL